MKRYAIVYADGSNRRLTQTTYASREEGGDYDDVPASMLDERHMKFAKPNMPTHWMKMPTHP